MRILSAIKSFYSIPNPSAVYGNSTMIEKLDEATGQMIEATQYDFTSVALFWVIASAISFLLPVFNWKYRK